VNITQPNAVTANINASSNVLCNGGNTGSASVTAGGGHPDILTAGRLPAEQDLQQTILLQADYTVTVTDISGCTQTATVNITQPRVVYSGNKSNQCELQRRR
jgi:hypothetical protein